MLRQQLHKTAYEVQRTIGVFVEGAVCLGGGSNRGGRIGKREGGHSVRGQVTALPSSNGVQ